MSEYIFCGVILPEGAAKGDGVLVKREKITRCRDCKHFTLRGTQRFEDGSTNADFCEYIRGWMLQVNPDGYCAWGERKSEGE